MYLLQFLYKLFQANKNKEFVMKFTTHNYYIIYNTYYIITMVNSKVHYSKNTDLT